MTNESSPPVGLGSSEGLGAAVPRRYPLDVHDCSGDDGNACYSKGHHDREAFKAAALAWFGEDMSAWDGPRHEWWRVVPDHTGEYRCVFHEAKPGTRGAFPVTVMDRY